jgi:hypothetical protein
MAEELDWRDSIEACIAFSSRDWSLNHRDAWIFGVINGWSPEALAEQKQRHNWSDSTVTRLKKLHEQYLKATTTTGEQPMTEQITLEEALELVEFEFAQGEWRVVGVKTNVGLYVWGTIRGRDWEFIETPEEKFRRLLDATGDKELIDAFHQFDSTQPATKS